MSASIILDLTNKLSSLSVNSYSEVAYVAKKTVDYTHALTAGQLSTAEYSDLIADLSADQIVATTSDEEELKSELCSYINQLESILIAAAGMIK